MHKRQRWYWLPMLVGVLTVHLAAALTEDSASHSQTAIERLEQLRGQMTAARERQESSAYVDQAEQQNRFLNGSPPSRLELARAEIQLGNTGAALEELRAYARMGQASHLIETSPQFATLRALPGFPPLHARMLKNGMPIVHSSMAFRLSNPQLLPEDIDYDVLHKHFVLSSVLQHKLVSVDAAGNVVDFAAAPDDWPVMAVKIDQKRQLLWATEVAVEGFDSVEKSAQGRSALLCFDLQSAKLLRRIEGPRPSALGDITLTLEGDVIASDGDHGGVYRLKVGADQWERLDGGDFISPQTAAMAPDGAHIYIPDYTRGIGILDLKTKKVQWMGMNGKFALNGIDGLYRVADTLIAVQNGTDPERVVQFSMHSSGSRIIAEAVIERSTATLGDPTHAVMVEGALYYIANSGWDVLDASGKVEPGKSMTAAFIMRAALLRLSETKQELVSVAAH
jgi:hypothetical protein